MGATSKIEWTDATWTPLRARNIATGKIGWHCEHVTEGCRNCYAERLNLRLGTQLPFKPGHRSDIEIFADPVMMTAPLRWRKPRRVFPWSMSDLFADFVPDDVIDQAFAVMALTPQHTYQVLTKRPARACRYITDSATPYRIARKAIDFLIDGKISRRDAQRLLEAETWPVVSEGDRDEPSNITMKQWPLPNLWLGVSIHDQASAESSVPVLLCTPAAKRFLSAEPLLGPVDLTGMKSPIFDASVNALTGIWKWHDGPSRKESPTIDWVIPGGESGQKARPMHPDWVRGLRDQCVTAGTAFFFKQWGEWEVSLDRDRDDPDWRADYSRNYVDHGKSRWLNLDGGCGFHGERFHVMRRVGKKAAGRLLDGREWNEVPS